MTNDEKNVTMMEALTSEVKNINTRLDKIETRLDSMETRLDNMQHDIKTGFEMLGNFVHEIEKSTTETEKRFNRLKQAI